MNESAASNFINSLVRNLQVLCHSNVEFRNDIEVVGHLYLKVDRQKKFNYIVDEKVCKNDASSTMFVSNSYHSVNLAPKKKDGQANEGSNKTNTDSSDSGSASADPNRVNSKGENRSVPSSPHHQPSSSGDMYRTPVKRGMRSPEAPTRKQPRMSGDMSGGTGPQSFSFSLQRDRESPHKPDRSMSQDSSSSFKDTGGSSEAVEIDLTNIKEEVIDDKSAIQASCFFNQEQQQMLGQSSVPPFPKEPGSDDMGLYPVSLHANESPNIDNLSQLASNLASGSSQGNPFSQSPQQMPQFLSGDSEAAIIKKELSSAIRSIVESLNLDWQNPPSLSQLTSQQKELFFKCLYQTNPKFRDLHYLAWNKLGEHLCNRRQYLNNKKLGKISNKKK